ncbi:reverse transcriptase domain-containing protein [Nonomuraea sp. NPDC049152]|uniref:reverse transcriptase domain-containing protein n=1 Tax=Nonomuraea sp. NPDC049152 TaxID=3154350 RepID=UPI00340B741A
MVLYIERWLQAPLRLPDGRPAERDRRTPQGSPVSPVLVNLFMHYAFDTWLAREYPTVQFERYADHAVVHCVTERQARQVLAAIENRMAQVGLRLHPGKTKIVYCQDGHRRLAFEHTSFTFLGFTFRQWSVRFADGRLFLRFMPAISKPALKKISAEVWRWRLHCRNTFTFTELARAINPIVAGWMQYYGAFNRSSLCPLLGRINAYLVRWIRRKYKRLQGARKAQRKLREITTRYPRMFVHWKWVPSSW